METAIAHLKDKGFRVTAARQALLSTLTESRQPLSLPELAATTDSDEASVYRNLELFKTEGLVEIIHSTASLPRFALAHEHHHHIVCEDCGTIAHLPCSGTLETPTHSQFASITHHEVTFYGLCTDCSV